ncbi:hypothetical protein N752_19545 [Desulforamulus aquiferis]|nr:vanadium-dependent haloperoxidase [Desulforamulus aquiferis]RYD03604.1 hypothetical protein N752_19545 [Desulforamulus aquiferis]
MALIFFERDDQGSFLTVDGEIVDFAIKHPSNIDFEAELAVVKKTLKRLTKEQMQIALYWGDGPPTKQWTPIIDRLIDTYNLSPVKTARVLGAVQGALNDAFVIAWYYKYLWDIPRPNQLDQTLATAICTPRFPAYPSGHSVMAGTVEVILSYFFSPEKERIVELAEEDSISRLYGGIHFPSDLIQGLRLGRQIGQIVVDILDRQYDREQVKIDIPITENLHAELLPPPYEQLIPYPPRARNCQLPLLPVPKSLT